MLSVNERQFLEAVRGWMTEPGTRTYLASATGDRAFRTRRMSDELKSALIELGVNPPAPPASVKDGGMAKTIRESLTRRATRKAAND